MGILDGATAAVGAVGSAASLVGAGPASALSGVADTLGSGLKGITSFLSGLSGAKGPKLPLPNPLGAYATYDYILGIGILTKDDLNNPDSTYRAGKRIPLVCKSANADYSNRVLTPYGRFDFFIDNLVLNSTIGMEAGNNTNVSTITFDIIEPYSMGMFLMAIQTAAQKSGWDNYRDAAFLLTIQFRGNKENGQMEIIKNTARQIPFKFTSFAMSVTQSGAKYTVTANAYNQEALTTKNANLKTDVAVKGKTVQEVLQTGPKSLQAVVNERLQQYKKAGIVAVPDEVLILFPDEVASSATAAGTKPGQKENKTSATQSTQAAPDDLMIKLGVTYSEVNKTLVQPDGVCNVIGAASMGFDADRKADTPMNGANTVYDPKLKVNVRGNNTFSVEEGNFKFNQNTDIPTAINQVILASSYPEKALDVANLTPTGMRQWWRIDTQVYVRGSKENLTKTGKLPRLIVYRVIPYEAHSSRITAPNVKAPGFDQLKKQAVKHYNYLYTGKNTEVLRFDIDFKASLDALMTADSLKGSQDIQTSDAQGSSTEDKANKKGLEDGKQPDKKSTPSSVAFAADGTRTDKRGGGGADTSVTRAARIFHDAITYGSDMITLNMDIIGDPYWIAQSGTGNYTSKPVTTNLNEDGSVNYQTGEVDILVNFRTPVDLNQATGLYNFGGASKSAPVLQFSGLYYVNTIVSNFKQGKFTQTLSGARRVQQESDGAGDAKGTLNVSSDDPANDPGMKDFYG